MITLIRGAQVFAPEPLGVNDILIAGSQILAIEADIHLTGQHINVIDARGLIAMPGFVDSLVHVIGGGGEGGFHTRTPEMHLTDATRAGVTTVIGALGTDATTRALPDLVAKCRALENEGISAFCYSGSYQYPIRTYTDSLTEDIVMIDKIIGVGELAIADHRASHLSVHELVRVASDARVGGMLAGKSGVVSIHTGDDDSKLNLLRDAISTSAIPASQFYPTHINRNPALLDDGIAWTRVGGMIDMTTSTNEVFIEEGEVPAAEAIAYCLKHGVPVEQLTMSSDGNASLPVFDQNRQLCGLEVGQVASLHQSLQSLADIDSVGLHDAIATVTSSPARVLGLRQKGRLVKGSDADVVLAQPDTLDIAYVLAKGQTMVADGEVKIFGTFES